jgi:hypothetical protein
VSSNHGLLKSGIDIFAEVSSRESSFLSWRERLCESMKQQEQIKESLT